MSTCSVVVEQPALGKLGIFPFSLMINKVNLSLLDSGRKFHNRPCKNNPKSLKINCIVCYLLYIWIISNDYCFRVYKYFYMGYIILYPGNFMKVGITLLIYIKSWGNEF